MTVTGIYLRLRNLDSPYFPLLAVWTLSMISLPIIRWVWGEAALAWGVSLTVVVQVAVVLIILALQWGARRVLVVAVAVVVLTWGVEFLGSSTGFPFGSYHYTGRLQPQVASKRFAHLLSQIRTEPRERPPKTTFQFRRDQFQRSDLCPGSSRCIFSGSRFSERPVSFPRD